MWRIQTLNVQFVHSSLRGLGLPPSLEREAGQFEEEEWVVSNKLLARENWSRRRWHLYQPRPPRQRLSVTTKNPFRDSSKVCGSVVEHGDHPESLFHLIQPDDTKDQAPCVLAEL